MSEGESADARAEMQSLYESLIGLRERLNELKKKTAKGVVDNYTLKDSDGNDVTLGDLFGDKQDLIVIQNMGKSCPYCTLWADGFTGIHDHLRDRAAVAVASPDAPDVQKEFAEGRNWPFRMVSSLGSEFKRHLGFESDTGDQMPGVSTFRKEDDKIVNVANDYFGPGDDYCSVWHFLDLLRDGPDGWAPKYSY